MPRHSSNGGLRPSDIDKARKRMYVRFMSLGSSVYQACERSGLSQAEARAFRKSEEYPRMMRVYWDRYLREHFKTGSHKLFVATVQALKELTQLINSSAADIRLRAISELRQWLSDPKNEVLKRLSDQILMDGDSLEDEGEEYTEEEAEAAKRLLNAARKAQRERRGNDHSLQ